MMRPSTNKGFDRASFLRLALEELVRGGYADAGAVVLADSEKQSSHQPNPWRLEAHCGLSEPFVESVKSLLQIEFPATLLSSFSRATVAVPVAELPPAGLQALLLREGFVHQATTALMTEGTMTGVIAMGRKEARAFSKEDLVMLDLLGLLGGLDVHGTQFYEDLKRANEERRQTYGIMLQEQRLHALGEMASGIVHDINNTLTPILGFSELLLTNREWDAESRRRLEVIKTGASDIAAMVARLREFYRKRPEKESLAAVEVARLVSYSVSLTRPRWRDMLQERGVVVHVRTHIHEEVPPILGVEAELRELLTNLIINAVDAMPNGGEIMISAYPEQPWVVLDVEDMGTGMTEEVRGQCLEPFFSTKGEAGTGMGLAVVYEIVKRHDGEIDVWSEPGKGTRITLRLPAAGEGRRKTGPLPQVQPARILCVDDEPQIRAFLKEALTEAGHAVEVAGGGQAAIDAFASGAFDVVVTDVGMPEVDGRAVAAAVKARSPTTPVILLTGWGTPMRAAKEIPEGVEKILSKPVTSRQLHMALAEVLSPRERPEEKHDKG